MEIKDLQVGQEVVMQDGNNIYSKVKISRLTEKFIFVGNVKFYKPKFTDRWDSWGDSFRYRKSLYPASVAYLAYVADSEKRQAEKREADRIAREEKERKEAEHAAFLETPEGKKWLETEEQWMHSEIVVDIQTWGDNREAQIWLKGNDKKLEHEVKVTQCSDFVWPKGDNEGYEIYKPCEIQSYNLRVKHPAQVRKFTELLFKAAEIAELWDAERKGKIIPKRG